jgi:hypothetical protein
MRLFHRTAWGPQILKGGFRDARGKYGTDQVFTGVWLSDVPMTVSDSVEGDGLLAVEMPEHVVAEFEWIEAGKGFREFLVPADVVNRYPVRVVDEDDEGPVDLD